MNFAQILMLFLNKKYIKIVFCCCKFRVILRHDSIIYTVHREFLLCMLLHTVKFWKGYLMNTHSSVLYFTLVCGAFTADTATKLIERVSGPKEPKVPMAMKTILTYNKQQTQRIRKWTLPPWTSALYCLNFHDSDLGIHPLTHTSCSMLFRHMCMGPSTETSCCLCKL